MSDSCDPMDCSPSGSSVHGILQARILEQVAMHPSRGSSQPNLGSSPGLLHCSQILYYLSHGEAQEYWSGYTGSIKNHLRIEDFNEKLGDLFQTIHSYSKAPNCLLLLLRIVLNCTVLLHLLSQILQLFTHC